MERRAKAAESLIARSSGKEALDHAIQAVELYMRAAGEATDKSEATRLRRHCQKLIAYAEDLKARLSLVPSTGRDVLNQVSSLHGNDFPPWESDPVEAEFQLPPNGELFTDDSIFTLSQTQTANFAAWTRPMYLFGSSNGSNSDIDKDEAESLMQSLSRPNLVQDVTTDCSVVASLSAAIEVLTGRHAVLSSLMYPFDHKRGHPELSASGKYVLRMNFNGCFRRVVIDDRLPASKTERTIFVIDRQNPRLIWPALLEKAYLKVRGGYDFPGSNSGTDLWVLTGWIPEQVFLQREDFNIDETWNRIKTAHDAQDVVITLGTGRVSTEEEELMGLVGEHDYAVQSIDTTEGARNLLIKNPWSNGPVWADTRRSGLHHGIGGTSSSGILSPEQDAASPMSGTLWMSFEDVAQHFESMYLNWNPALFLHRQDHHFTWEIPEKRIAVSLVRNPQYSLTFPKGGPVWILVSRHFVDAELDIARNRRDSMAAVARQLGFMSILIFENNGNRVQTGEGEMYRGPLVDSPQTLVRMDTEPGKPYTVVVDQCEFPLSSYTFTLSLFSQAAIEVTHATEKMSYFKECLGNWNRRTAGGNSSCPTFFRNPQFKISITQTGPVSILLSTDGLDIHVHIDLVWAQGRRVTTLRVKDLIASSGEYCKKCAVANIENLDPGTYTVVCSTFEAAQTANFALRVASMTPVTVESVPADAAGMLRTPLSTTQLLRGGEKRRVALNVSWLTRASVSLRPIIPRGSEYGSGQSSSALISVYVVHGRGPQQVIVAELRGDDLDGSTTSLRTEEFDMEPERIRRDGMWIVVESLAVHNTTQYVEGEVISDFPVAIGTWEPLSG